MAPAGQCVFAEMLGISEHFTAGSHEWLPYSDFSTFPKQYDKLVFESAHHRLSVIANQCAHWCGNPPVRGKMYRIAPERVEIAAILGGNRYLVPFNRGIATPVCALVRNDR